MDITYCVQCGKPLYEEEAAKKAIAHQVNPEFPDDPKQGCKRLWRNRWKRFKKSYRVTPDEFALVVKHRRGMNRKAKQVPGTVSNGVGHSPTQV